MEVPEMVAKLRRLFALDTDDMEAIAAKLESLAADYDRLRAERDALAGAHGRLVEVVDEVQFCVPSDDGPTMEELEQCPWCSANRCHGHKPDCRLNAALSLARDLPADGVREAAKAHLAQLRMVAVPDGMGNVSIPVRVIDEFRAALEPRP